MPDKAVCDEFRKPGKPVTTMPRWPKSIMVPLIDVMLVLVVIFLVTAPMLTHTVKVDLPKASPPAPSLTKPDVVQLAIDAESRIYWNGEVVDAAGLSQHLSAAAKLPSQPELHIRAERTTPYERVAQIMSEAARAGSRKLVL